MTNKMTIDMKWRFCACASLFCGMLFIAESAYGQRGAVSPQKEQECRGREARLMAAGRADSLENLLSSTIECPDAGGDLLAKRWLQAPEDSASLNQLVWFSARLQDGRIFNAVTRVASDRSKSTLVRANAIRVMWSYANPGNGLPILGGIGANGKVGTSGTSTVSQAAGIQHLPASVEEQVHAWAIQTCRNPSEDRYIIAVSKSLLDDLFLQAGGRGRRQAFDECRV